MTLSRKPLVARARLPLLWSAIAFTAVMALTLLIWVPMTRQARVDGEAEFLGRTHEVTSAIAARITAYEQVLHAGAALFSVDPEVHREDWRRFFEALDVQARYPGFQGLGYVEYVPGGHLPAFLQRVRTLGLPDFSVMPDGERFDYAPITFMEPLSGHNAADIGMDLLVEPACRAAMERARDQSKAMMSGRLRGMPGMSALSVARFLMVLPIYRGAQPPQAITERRERLAGFVMASLRLDQLLPGILGDGPLGLDFAVFEDAADAEPMYRDTRLGRTLPDGFEPAFVADQILQVAGQQWRVHFSSADAGHQIAGARRARLLLQGGIVTAVLLALLVWLLGTTRIRARVLAEDMASAYRDSEQRLRTITDNLPGLVSYLDAEGRFGFVNRTHDEWFGIPAREFVGKTFIEVFGVDAPRDPAVDALVQRGHDGERGSVRSWLPQAGRWVHVSVVPDLHPEGVAGIYMLLVDVTALKLAEDALFAERDRAQTTLRAIADAVIVTDASGRISYVNPTAEVITGCASSDAVGQHVDDVFRVIAADTGARIVDPLTLALRENRIRTLPTDALLQQRGGASVAVEDSAAPIHDRDGNVTGAVIVFRDVSASRELALRMAHMAQHDPLTDLPNRLLLEDRLRQAIALAERNARAAAVLFIDLDRFKLINDSLGHAVGDRLLQHVARVLVSCVRRSDTVCRLGGDEFVVLLPEINGPRDAMHVADKLLTALQTPIVLDGDELRVSCSIGISMFPSDGADPPTLLKNADAAMYHAKHGGRNRHAFFTDEIDERAHARLQTETRLQRAIEVGELRLHYQPKVDSRSGRLIGLEALVRWQREPDRLCQPAEFLPIAEDSGLIAEVDAWVLRQALAQLRAWRELGLPVVPVAVNLSVTHFSDDRLLELVGDALAAAGLAPSMLQIEITESQLLRNTERTQRLLASLKRLGVGIAIDDFGTGYSSLGYLCRFPVDVLKIDRSFVATMAEDRRQAVIVQAITGMAKTLGYRVVAEGVEREIEAQMLRADACDELQGFLYSRPLPPDDCAALLQRSAVAGERSMWPGFAAP